MGTGQYNKNMNHDIVVIINTLKEEASSFYIILARRSIRVVIFTYFLQLTFANQLEHLV
jgi:hypothetical protein